MDMGGDMKKERKKRYSLGDHIVALFEEANQLSLQPVEQKVMVYAALKHLLKNTSAASIQLPSRLTLRTHGGIRRTLIGKSLLNATIAQNKPYL